MTKAIPRRTAFSLIFGLILVASLLVAPPPADASQFISHSSHAWGSHARVLGGTVLSGTTARVGLTGCAATGASQDNAVASADLGVGSVDGVSSETFSYAEDGVEGVYSHNEIAGVSLLGGEIEIGAIEATVEVRQLSDGTFETEADTSIASLAIGGEEIEILGGPQVLRIAGLATISLNRTVETTEADYGRAAATAVTVRLADGTDTVVRLGRAYARTDAVEVDRLLGGWANGSVVRAFDGTIDSGPTANSGVPCIGSEGNPLTTSIASVDVGVAELDTVVSTTTSDVSPSYVNATNTIESVSLLSGLVTLEAISVEVNAEVNESDELEKTSTASLGSITLNAGPIPVDIPVPELGGSVDIPGVGTLTLHEEINPPNGIRIEAYAVSIDLLEAVGGGVTIELGRARAVLRDPPA